MTVSYLSKWQAVADDILSVLLVNPARWVEVIDAAIDPLDMPPGNWITLFNTVIGLAADQTENTSLMDTAVATKAGAGVSVEWVAERMALYDAMREGAFKQQLAAVKLFGRVHRAIQITQRGVTLLTAAANNGLEVEEPMQNILKDLQQEQMVTRSATVSLTDLMAENKAAMEADPVNKAETGIWLLDKWIVGMKPNEFVAWVAPYKSRKTSIMANVLITALRRKDQVDVFSLDESRADFIYRLEALLIAEYMWNSAQYDHPLNNVDVKTLLFVGKGWKKWDKVLQDAFQYAWDTLSSLGKYCRIYDLATCRPTTASIAALCRADAARHGGIDMVFVDHIQSLTGYKSIFDKVEEGSADLHVLRGELQCRMWMLAQQNEEAVKSSLSGGWSPQVKGGGGVAAKADTIVISKYKQGQFADHANIVRIELNNARNDESQMYGYCEIHPASGWITPRENVVKELNLQDAQDAVLGARQ